MSSFIALHRKIEDSFVYQDSVLLHLWVHCLIRASHKDRTVIFDGVQIDIKRGQFITGRKSLSKALNTTEQKIRRRIGLLVNKGKITQKTTNKYSIITVVKYDYYQGDAKKTTSREPAENQQRTTNNNGVIKDNNLGEANASQKLPTNSEKDMKWTPRASDNDDDLDVIDIETGEPAKPKEKVVRHYKEVYEVFKHFGMYSIDWTKNRTEQKAGDDLYTEKGIEQIEKALRLYKENKDQEFCPLIYSPSTLIRKWKSLLEFKKKNEI